MDKKIALVTGASHGIGKAIAIKLLENNYYVILNYYKSEKEANEILSKYTQNLEIYKADVSNYNEDEKMISDILKKFKKIDLLVNNAGIDLVETISDTKIDDYRRVMDINFSSVFYLTKLVSSEMIHYKSGNIINISSIYGETGASVESIYAASKACINAFTKSCAYELAPSNIRVNAIAPGAIDTRMNNFLNNNEKNDLVNSIPLGRLGTPMDVAEGVIFLEKCSYITGEILNINGGWKPC